MSILALNKSARHDYDIIESYEAGIKLTGDEVKSCKSGQINLRGSYAVINERGVPYLIGCQIAPYKHSSRVKPHEPLRSRRLLLRAKELSSLIGSLKEKRLTLAPLAFHNKRGLIKVELGLGRGKKQFEKREAIKKRDIEREVGRRFRR